jgi:hypothetical protein
VHWVFAMKYWGVAKKLQLLETNQDPDKFNLVFQRIFWVGFVLNVMSGILLGVPYFVVWYNWFVNLIQICIFFSCGFLIDAFRLLSKLKSREKSISKKQAALLSFAFGAFGASLMIKGLASALQNSTFFNVSSYFQNVFFYTTCLAMLLILNSLTNMQHD